MGRFTTGAANIAIDSGAEVDSPTGDGQINIDDRYFHDRICLMERSADPVEPDEGETVVWMSDGTGKGDDGDVLVASTAGRHPLGRPLHA